jgi:hypothetical protein
MVNLGSYFNYAVPMGKFDAVLRELQALHDKKNQDYGKTNDPFANVRAGEDFGVEPWVSGMIRANDKMRRLQKAATGKTLANESIEDSLVDLAVYVIISLILWREGQENDNTTNAVRDMGSTIRFGLSPTTLQWTTEWAE